MRCYRNERTSKMAQQTQKRCQAKRLLVSGNSLLRSGERIERTLAGDISKTEQLKRNPELIEREYIQNLQKQVHLLETEASYLRDNDQRKVDLQARISLEKRPLQDTIKELQNLLRVAQDNAKRNLVAAEAAQSDKERLSQLQAIYKENHQRREKQLLDDILLLKDEQEVLKRNLTLKEIECNDFRRKADVFAAASQSVSAKHHLLEKESSQQKDRLVALQISLEEKRDQLQVSESRRLEAEDKLLTSSRVINDKVKEDLRDELRLLKHKLKSTELATSQDKHLRTKLSEDNSRVVQENVRLEQRISELEKVVENERSVREQMEQRRAQNFAELARLREIESKLNDELDHTKALLTREKARSSNLMEMLSSRDQLTISQILDLTQAYSRLEELKLSQRKVEDNADQLVQDKGLLIEHVAELQRQLYEKEAHIEVLRDQIRSLEFTLRELQPLRDIQSSIHSQKWEDFASFAETMRDMARAPDTPLASSQWTSKNTTSW